MVRYANLRADFYCNLVSWYRIAVPHGIRGSHSETTLPISFLQLAITH